MLARGYSGSMDIMNREKAVPFITKDGSEIRELLAYRNSSIRNQSLAEATLPPGASTAEHYHVLSEEIYYILKGRALMRIEGEERLVGALDVVAIPPGKRHQIINLGSDELKLLCCCAPAYEHEDTVLIDDRPSHWE